MVSRLLGSTGKMTLARAVGESLMASSYWREIYETRISPSHTLPGVTFAVLAGFGIAAAAPDTNPLKASFLLMTHPCSQSISLQLPSQRRFSAALVVWC